jgi:hypothetical protein
VLDYRLGKEERREGSWGEKRKKIEQGWLYDLMRMSGVMLYFVQ